MAVTTLDGRAFEKFVAAGTYFLRKYRTVLDDLNVFPVPDGDTGSNMYFTARAALSAAHKVRDQPLSVVAGAAARGSLLGARGNSGVILSQLLRGFAHTVRHRDAIDTLQLSIAMRDAVAAARGALMKPVEGTIISVAGAAAEEAYRLSAHETDFYRLTSSVVRAANAALERTPDQLPALKEAGVVDSGGAGFVYFLEGALRFLPDATLRTTAFPQRPIRSRVFTARQTVGDAHFCTEFVLDDARIELYALRDLLAEHGESLIVAGDAPTFKVHLHTANGDAVANVAAGYGSVTRLKIEDMAMQHRLLVVDAPERPFSIVAIVPGAGFERIARELGAEVTVAAPDGMTPSVADLLVAVNSTLGERVMLLANDPNVLLAAREVVALTAKTLDVIASPTIVAGLALQIAYADAPAVPSDAAVSETLAGVGAASLFFAGKDSAIGGVAVERGAPTAAIGERIVTAATLSNAALIAARELGAGAGGLLTIYYGGRQRLKDVQRVAAALGKQFPQTTVEYYFGGQSAIELWLSFER